MLEGLTARSFIEQKQTLTHIHIICLLFFSFFFRHCRETEVRICSQLHCVDVMYQIWYHPFHLTLVKFSSFNKYSYAFSIVGIMKMKDVFTM